MTDNQEKELFNTLAALVTGVNVIQSDVKGIKETLNDHSRILDSHSRILDDHSRILDNHSQILNRLDAKTDSIAETVMTNDKRLMNAEKKIEELQIRVH